LLKWAVGRNRKKHFSFHTCSSASCSKNEERLVGNSLGQTKKDMGVLGVAFLFLYDISSWMKRSLLNEASLTVQELRKALTLILSF
jgi:hypothetical protein